MNTPPPGGRNEVLTDAEIDRASKIVALHSKRAKLKLRITFSRIFLAVLLIQLGIVDIFLWVYSIQRDWNVASSVIVAYISGAVVQVIGVVAIMVRYFFDPQND